MHFYSLINFDYFFYYKVHDSNEYIVQNVDGVIFVV